MAYRRNREFNSGAENRLDEPANRKNLRRMIRLVFTNFGRRIDPDIELQWIDRLEKLPDASVVHGLNKACEQDRFPSLGVVLQLCQQRQANTYVETPKLTENERNRSDHSAILSMLWLYYAKGWKLSDFSGTIFEKKFPGDPQRILAKAAEIYPKEVALKWMDDQVRAGH